jgi:hypothetical protein
MSTKFDVLRVRSRVVIAEERAPLLAISTKSNLLRVRAQVVIAEELTVSTAVNISDLADPEGFSDVECSSIA